jgi:hypothetical protein
LLATNAFLASALFRAIASRRLTAGIGSGGSLSGDALRGIAALEGVDFVRILGEAGEAEAAVGVLERGVPGIGTANLLGDLGTREEEL